MDRKMLQGLTSIVAGAAILVALAVALSLPNTSGAPIEPQVTPNAPTAPKGCQPVAPGSYTFICDGTGSVSQPQAPAAPEGCRAVAPGSYTFICEGTGSAPVAGPDVPAAPKAPAAPEGCRAVAPGSYTFICEDN
ncbi:hypothetical protein BH23CHL7_BH23CHL7_03480 [soil metagenome]